MNINKQLNIPRITKTSKYRIVEEQGLHTPYTGTTDWDLDAGNLEGIQDDNWYIRNEAKPFCKGDYNYIKGRSSIKGGDGHNCTQYGADCYWNEHYGACKCPSSAIQGKPHKVWLKAEGDEDDDKKLSTLDKLGIGALGLIVIIIGGVILYKRAKK